jgi:uncharacterized protein YegL
MRRRLPVYFLIDTSRSMTGTKINAVNESLNSIFSILRKDPMALETVWISIIVFNTDAHQILPLTSIIMAKPPLITAKGWTNIEAGLLELEKCVLAEVIKNDIKKEVKGDWKPIVFMFSDGGQSKGNWKKINDETNNLFKGFSSFNAFVATGGSYKSYVDEIKMLVGNFGTVKLLDDFDKESIEEIISFVSQSIQLK